MIPYVKCLLITILLGFLMFTQAQAQRGKGNKSTTDCSYDINTVEKISGEIVSIKKITKKKMNHYGVHLIVKTDVEIIEVHLGPGWFIDGQDETLVTGDIVIINGSRITYKDEPALIAREIKRGGYSLLLRDEQGFPLWRGQGRKM